jgi:hypothetical protein
MTIGVAKTHTHLLEEIGREIVDGLGIVTSVVGVVIEIIEQGEKTLETVLGGGEMVLLTRNQRAEETIAGIAVRGKTPVMHRAR